jgi:hypothetical protein
MHGHVKQVGLVAFDAWKCKPVGLVAFDAQTCKQVGLVAFDAQACVYVSGLHLSLSLYSKLVQNLSFLFCHANSTTTIVFFLHNQSFFLSSS